MYSVYGGAQRTGPGFTCARSRNLLDQSWCARCQLPFAIRLRHVEQRTVLW